MCVLNSYHIQQSIIEYSLQLPASSFETCIHQPVLTDILQSYLQVRYTYTAMSSTNTTSNSGTAARTSTATYTAPPSYTSSHASSIKSTSSTAKKHLAEVFTQKRENMTCQW
jgi:hypothetical protein